MATLGNRAELTTMLDNGFEVNLIPRWVFGKLNWPVNTNINWSISDYNESIVKNVKRAGIIGVLHDISVTTGGIEVKLKIFVVGNWGLELLLGRSFERTTPAAYFNEDHRSVTLHLRSQDGRQEVIFTAVKGNHARNRKYARDTNSTKVKFLKD
jgi:hypothetical protein